MGTVEHRIEVLGTMKTVGLITEECRGVDNVCHLRFMALLYALVRENGKQEFSPRTTISTPVWNLVM